MASTAMRRQWLRPLGLLLALGLVAAACGGGGDDGGGGDGGAGGTTGGDEGTPTPGGRVVYGLEAESIAGWCLTESRLAISGIQVTSAIYDTLTRPNAEGGAEPWLAESVEPNDDYTQWTITLRDGITFHDGSPLTAEVVKNNLDAYRGQYPTRHPDLFIFVFEPIQSVDVVDPLTVSVMMKQPWVSFDSQLWSSGRLGMMAQAQLDDERTCDRTLIGTGPFSLADWVPNQSFTAEKNPDYWATDAEGNQLPYLDEIEFRPIVDSSQRVNALESGEINAMHTSEPEGVSEIREQTESGQLDSYETDEFGETAYIMLNVSKPPFDNIKARQALAYALPFDDFNAILGDGILTQATGPFAPGNIGNLDMEDLPDFPEYDPDRARQLVEEYEAETGQPLSFTYTTTQAQYTIEQGEFNKQHAEEVGMSVQIVTLDQSAQINAAITGDYDALGWRNHPGGDPDLQYNWWKTGSPVNFGRFSDPEIDRLLDEGRTTADPAAREQIFEDLNGRFTEQFWNIWVYYAPWIVGTAPDVHGVPGEGPSAPAPFPGLAVGHSVAYMWVEQ